MLGALVFLSGAAALVYELVWARWLSLALGAGTQAAALVVAVTMLGLGLGNWLGGRAADRAPSPLRLYGLLELSVALAALSAGAVLRAQTSGTTPLGAAWAAAALLLAPTALMGATLPALTAHAARASKRGLPGLGELYAWNTTGAVAGSLAAGFLLIRVLGLWGAVLAAAAANLAAGAGALLLARRDAAPARALAEGGARGTSLSAAAVLGAAASGLCGLAYEILTARVLVHGFLSTSHALTIIFSVFIAGLAIGAHLVNAALKKTAATAEFLGLALLGAAALSLATAPSLVQSTKFIVYVMGSASGWGTRVLAEAFVSAVLLLPVTVVMGFALPLAAAMDGPSGRPGRDAGRLLLANTIAGMSGALLAGFVLLPVYGLRKSLWLTACAQALAGAALLQGRGASSPRRRALGWTACAALAALGGLWARPPVLGAPPGEGTLIPPASVGSGQDDAVLCYREGALATTAVVLHRSSGIVDLFIDGFVTAAKNAPNTSYMALMGRLPMVLHPRPRKALLICLGTGATGRALAEWPDADVDVVDINPDVVACAPAFGPENVRFLARARVHVEDGRRFLARGRGTFDVITQEPMPPHFSGVSSLYSVEYYRLARRRLSDDGVLVQWLPLHLTAPRDARAIVGAAAAVFPETWVALAPGDQTGLVVSSMRPLDAARRARAEKTLGVRFVLDPDAARRYAAGVAPVTDDRPSLEYSGIDRVYGVFGSPYRLFKYNVADLSRFASRPRTP